MQIVNPSADAPITICFDNVVASPDGLLIVESMFSGVYDLSSPGSYLAARIHPQKAKVLNWIATGTSANAVVTTESSSQLGIPIGTTVALRSDIELHVNGPNGVKPIAYTAILDHSCKLVASGTNDVVLKTTTIPGFDPIAEPVLRVLEDGNWLLLFYNMPPFHKLKTFNMDAFGRTLQASVESEVVWDDRDVFVIMMPSDKTAQQIQNTIRHHT